MFCDMVQDSHLFLFSPEISKNVLGESEMIHISGAFSSMKLLQTIRCRD